MNFNFVDNDDNNNNSRNSNGNNNNNNRNNDNNGNNNNNNKFRGILIWLAIDREEEWMKESILKEYHEERNNQNELDDKTLSKIIKKALKAL